MQKDEECGSEGLVEGVKKTSLRFKENARTF